MKGILRIVEIPKRKWRFRNDCIKQRWVQALWGLRLIRFGDLLQADKIRNYEYKIRYKNEYVCKIRDLNKLHILKSR